MTLLIIGALAVLALVLSFQKPEFALWLWIIVCGFVPFWVGITTPFFLCALSVVGIAIIAGSLWRGQITLTHSDLWITIVAILILACGLIGIARPGDVTSVMAQWVVSYLVARILVEAVGARTAYQAIAVVFSAVALCTVFEFLLDSNPYFSWVVNNSQYRAWGYGQIRGGITRAEWAFGHSIALGCALGMAIPVIAATKQRGWVKVVQIVLCGLGVVFTFSRAGFVTAVVGILLALFFSRDTGSVRIRIVALAGAAALTYFVTPLITSVFQADNGQAVVSSDYRGLLNSLIATMNPFGLASGYSESAPGSYSFGSFQSIDSTFVFLGVSFGYIIALLALLAAGILVVRALLRRCSPAELGVVAVIPALFTVAPITQFGSLLFFYIGMSVAIAAKTPQRMIQSNTAPIHRERRQAMLSHRPHRRSAIGTSTFRRVQ